MSDSSMTNEEMLARIKELEEENNRLKNAKTGGGVLPLMKNRKALNFIAPYFSVFRNEWTSVPGGNINNLRNIAVSCVDYVDENNNVVRQKIPSMGLEDLRLVAECADELVEVVVKYKKQYLISIGREDVVKAFNV